MKRLGDFLNVESFDLALLEEVGCMEGTAVEAWLGGGLLGIGVQETFPLGEGLHRHPPPYPRCGVSRTSST